MRGGGSDRPLCLKPFDHDGTDADIVLNCLARGLGITGRKRAQHLIMTVILARQNAGGRVQVVKMDQRTHLCPHRFDGRTKQRQTRRLGQPEMKLAIDLRRLKRVIGGGGGEIDLQTLKIAQGVGGDVARGLCCGLALKQMPDQLNCAVRPPSAAAHGSRSPPAFPARVR